MKIRKASKNDFRRIAEIIKDEYIKKPYSEKWTTDNAIRTLEHFSKTGEIFVAVERGRVVGVIIIREELYNTRKNAVIEDLVVDGNFQGSGIGKSLIKFVEEHCKSKGINAINLYASKIALAYQVYKGLGYTHNEHMAYFSKGLK